MKDFAPVASAPRGKGPRTKRQVKRRRVDTLIVKPKGWAPRSDGDPEAVRENGTLQERGRA